MNLAIRGINANLGAAARDTFSKDQHQNEKFDFTLQTLLSIKIGEIIMNWFKMIDGMII